MHLWKNGVQYNGIIVDIYDGHPEAIPMAKFTLPLRDIKVEYARSHPLTKVVVIALILVCMAALITLSVTGSQLKREIAQLRQEAAYLAAENAELKEKIDAQGK